MMNSKISVIIAAYNEAPRIAKVLEVVENHPLINEVIVVDDGSEDKTSEIAQRYNVTLIKNNKNAGKTISIRRGVEASKNDLIMFLDADLEGLDKESVDKLVKPVLDGVVDWTLCYHKSSFGFMRLAKIDWISGGRVVPKKLLADPLIWSKPNIGYGLEILMNKSLLAKHKSFRSVYWPNVVNISKSKKIGRARGWTNELIMNYQIVRAASLHEYISQFVRMSYLNRKYHK